MTISSFDPGATVRYFSHAAISFCSLSGIGSSGISFDTLRSWMVRDWSIEPFDFFSSIRVASARSRFFSLPRAIREIGRFGDGAFLLRVRLRPRALRSVVRDEALHLLDDLVALVELVVREQDLLLPGRRAHVVRRFGLEHLVDADRLVELAG